MLWLGVLSGEVTSHIIAKVRRLRHLTHHVRGRYFRPDGTRVYKLLCVSMKLPARRAIGALLFTFACVACSNSATDPATGSTDTSVEAAVGVQAEIPRVTLTNPGTGQLQELRYSDAKDSQSTTQEVPLAIAQGFAQQPWQAEKVDPTAPAGGDVITLSATANAAVEPTDAELLEGDELNEDATRHVQITFNDVEYDDLEQASEVRTIEGFQLGYYANTRGQISVLNLAAPADATDVARTIAEQYLLNLISSQVVFPEEPVGVGATWTVDTRVSGETALLQTTEYELVSRDGDTISLKMNITRRPSLGAIQNGETSLIVLSANTTADAQVSIDLSKPLPETGQIASTTRVVYGPETGAASETEAAGSGSAGSGSAGSDTRIVQDSTTAITFGG